MWHWCHSWGMVFVGGSSGGGLWFGGGEGDVTGPQSGFLCWHTLYCPFPAWLLKSDQLPFSYKPCPVNTDRQQLRQSLRTNTSLSHFLPDASRCLCVQEKCGLKQLCPHLSYIISYKKKVYLPKTTESNTEVEPTIAPWFINKLFNTCLPTQLVPLVNNTTFNWTTFVSTDCGGFLAFSSTVSQLWVGRNQKSKVVEQPNQNNELKDTKIQGHRTSLSWERNYLCHVSRHKYETQQLLKVYLHRDTYMLSKITNNLHFQCFITCYSKGKLEWLKYMPIFSTNPPSSQFNMHSQNKILETNSLTTEHFNKHTPSFTTGYNGMKWHI